MTPRRMYKELYVYLPEEENLLSTFSEEPTRLEQRRIKLKRDIRRENRWHSKPELQSLQTGAHHFINGEESIREYWIVKDATDEDLEEETQYLRYSGGPGQMFCHAYWYRLNNGDALIETYSALDI